MGVGIKMVKVMIYQGRPTGGGSKKSLFNIIKLLKKDLDFHIVVGSKGWFFDELSKQNITFEYYPENNKVQSSNFSRNFFVRKVQSSIRIICYGFKSLKQNYNYIKKNDIEYVILNETRDLYFLGLPALIGKCKIISFIRGEPNFFDIPRFLVSEHIISLSKRLATKLPFDFKKKVKVIPNYIEVPPKCIFKEEKLSQIQIAFLGSIIPVKGLENLIEIARRVNRNDFLINIYGDIPTEEYQWYLEKIKNLITKYNLEEKFIFHGWKDNVTDPIKESDIVVLTSLSEGLPRVILEAMAFSKPVMGFNVGGVEDLIENQVNGFLIRYGDYDNFAEGLSTLIADGNIRKSFGGSSLLIVKQKFSSEIVRNKLLNIFH